MNRDGGVNAERNTAKDAHDGPLTPRRTCAPAPEDEPVWTVHTAGPVEQDVQRCRRCGLVLATRPATTVPRIVRTYSPGAPVLRIDLGDVAITGPLVGSRRPTPSRTCTPKEAAA
jgi:hypothetical protein